jgi:hypothetical protein
VPSIGDLRPRTPIDPYNSGHYIGLAIGSDGVAQAAWPDLRPGTVPPDEPDIWLRGLRLHP